MSELEQLQNSQETTVNESFEKIVEQLSELQVGQSTAELELINQETTFQKPAGYADQGYRHG